MHPLLLVTDGVSPRDLEYKVDPVDRRRANGHIEWTVGKAMNWLRLAAQIAGVSSTEVGLGSRAGGGPGTIRACPQDRPPRDGGVPRPPHRRRSSRQRGDGWRGLPTGRRAAPGPAGTRRGVA